MPNPFTRFGVRPPRGTSVVNDTLQQTIGWRLRPELHGGFDSSFGGLGLGVLNLIFREKFREKFYLFHAEVPKLPPKGSTKAQ